MVIAKYSIDWQLSVTFLVVIVICFEAKVDAFCNLCMSYGLICCAAIVAHNLTGGNCQSETDWEEEQDNKRPHTEYVCYRMKPSNTLNSCSWNNRLIIYTQQKRPR